MRLLRLAIPTPNLANLTNFVKSSQVAFLAEPQSASVRCVRVSTRGGRPINETSYNHNVNSQPKFSRSASRLAVDQACVWGQDRNAQGMTANSVCILELAVLDNRDGSQGACGAN
jgi:hypothetical protein